MLLYRDCGVHEYPADHLLDGQFSSPLLSSRLDPPCLLLNSALTSELTRQVANNPQESQRACALGFLNSIGQCLSLAASYLFPKAEGPNYIKGAAINIGCSSVGLMIAFSMTMYYRYENRKRDKVEGRPAERGPSVEDVHTRYDRAPGECLLLYPHAVEPKMGTTLTSRIPIHDMIVEVGHRARTGQH